VPMMLVLTLLLLQLKVQG